MIKNGPFLLVFLIAFSTSLVLVPVAVFFSRRLGIMSKPGGRRHEQKPLPKMGGLVIYGGFTVSVIASQLLPVPRMDPNEIIRLAGLLIGGTWIFIVGILDDVYEFSWFPQLLGQIVSSGIAIACLIFIEFFNNPLTGQQTDPWPPFVTVTLTMFWMILMMNTVNFLDGLDGLAGGVALIASTTLFINSAFVVNPPQLSVSLLPLALMGACLGFLLYNFHPSAIIMGGGAPYLGFLLGSLSIIGGAKMATILLVMGLPLMDLAWQVVNRIRQRRNPLHGDRGHLHFRLLDSGLLSHRQIVVGYYIFCAFFGVLTLVTSSQAFKFITFGVMILLIIMGFAFVERLSHISSARS